jgi:hypothetical protein
MDDFYSMRQEETSAEHFDIAHSNVESAILIAVSAFITRS